MKAVEVNNLSKKYTIGSNQYKYLLVRDRLASAFLKPLLKIFSEKGEEYSAIDNVSFSLDQGDVLGIIGSNGAGKSTILKILSKVTPPSEGKIVLKGRTASLLEVGTGFHPELTGRENIFFNSSLLGMKKNEIKGKIDEIIEFSGVDKFIDMPVKKYSSGMQLRLAFSVAVFLDYDILLIDEILAVGDLEFKQKCIAKMEKISADSNKTIIIVSHDMNMIRRLCNKCLLLGNGRLISEGQPETVIRGYVEEAKKEKHVPLAERKDRIGEGNIFFESIGISSVTNGSRIKSGDKAVISIDYASKHKSEIENTRFYVSIFSPQGVNLVRFDNHLTGDSVKTLPPKGRIICETAELNFSPGIYSLWIGIYESGIPQDHISDALFFEIEENYQAQNMTPNRNDIPPVLVRHRFLSN